MDFLFEVHDPVTGITVGASTDNLASALEGEIYKHTSMYAGFAHTARDEGFEEIAEWFEMLALSEKSHAHHLSKSLRRLIE